MEPDLEFKVRASADSEARVTNRILDKLDSSHADKEKTIELKLHYLKPPAGADGLEERCVEEIPCPTISGRPHKIGPREYLPFILQNDSKDLHVYTYVDEEFKRNIVITEKEEPVDSEFWDQFPHGKYVAVELKPKSSSNIDYDSLQRELFEDEAGLHRTLEKVKSALASQTRRFKNLEKTAYFAPLVEEFEILSQNVYEEHKRKGKHVREAAEFGQSAFIFFFDIKKFKVYNDNYGKEIGDLAITEVGRALRSVFKKHTDYLYRPGGDEFVAVVHKTPLDGVLALAQKVEKAISEIRIENPLYKKDPNAFDDRNNRKIFEPDDRYIKIKLNGGYSELSAQSPGALRGKTDEDYLSMFKESFDEAEEKSKSNKKNSAVPSYFTHMHSKRYRELHPETKKLNKNQ